MIIYTNFILISICMETSRYQHNAGTEKRERKNSRGNYLIFTPFGFNKDREFYC